MRTILVLLSCLALSSCSWFHSGFWHSSKQPKSGTVVGVVEYDTGLTKFSTVTGMYHQDMCSKASGDVPVHLDDREMKKILAQADKSGFFKLKADLTTDWAGFSSGRPPHCANFRLRIDSTTRHNEVRWDCGSDASNAPPAEVAALVETVRKALWSKPEVQALPWSNCPVR